MNLRKSSFFSTLAHRLETHSWATDCAERRRGLGADRYAPDTTSEAGPPKKILDSDRQTLKTMEINGAHDEIQELFRPHIAAIT